MVEVAGIEPASERLQRVEPTCVSEFVRFRKRAVRTGKDGAPRALRDLGSNPRARGSCPACCVTSHSGSAGRIGET